MKTTLEKVISFVLAAIMIFAVPVISSAEEIANFNIMSSSISAASGTWKNDYVENLKVVLTGSCYAFGTNDVILTVGTNDSADDVCTVTKADIISSSFQGGSVTLVFRVDRVLTHAYTYKVSVKEGAFANRSGAVNNSYTASATGNAIIETLEIKQDELPKSPIEQLIVLIENWEYGKYFMWAVAIMRWFLSL